MKKILLLVFIFMLLINQHAINLRLNVIQTTGVEIQGVQCLIFGKNINKSMNITKHPIKLDSGEYFFIIQNPGNAPEIFKLKLKNDIDYNVYLTKYEKYFIIGKTNLTSDFFLIKNGKVIKKAERIYDPNMFFIGPIDAGSYQIYVGDKNSSIEIEVKKGFNIIWYNIFEKQEKNQTKINEQKKNETKENDVVRENKTNKEENEKPAIKNQGEKKEKQKTEPENEKVFDKNMLVVAVVILSFVLLYFILRNR